MNLSGRAVGAQQWGEAWDVTTAEPPKPRIQAAFALGTPLISLLCFLMLHTAALAWGWGSIRQGASIKANTKNYIFEAGGVLLGLVFFCTSGKAFFHQYQTNRGKRRFERWQLRKCNLPSRRKETWNGIKQNKTKPRLTEQASCSPSRCCLPSPAIELPAQHPTHPHAEVSLQGCRFGTHSHTSWTGVFPSKSTAFNQFALIFPNLPSPQGLSQ